VETVGGALGGALERVLRAPVVLTFAGRTDTGVHAWGQVVTLDAPPSVDPAAVQRSINGQLAPRVVVREAAVVDGHFDARRSAVSRRYRYTVLNRAAPDPFLAATTWHVEERLELAALRLSCDPLIGEHDFTSFCRAPKGVPEYSLVRRVVDARWTDVGEGLLRFEIEASSFCQQMVRAIVGTMVPMGAGRRRAGEMRHILEARNRAAAARVAPPHGLCLWSVRYPSWTS
jgi:tRNA pseudouridine38-40 synthase